MEAKAIPTGPIGLRLTLQHELGEVWSKLIGVHIEDTKLIDAVGGIVEVLCVRAFEITIEMQAETLRQQPLLHGLLRFLQSEADVFEFTSDRTRRFISAGIEDRKQPDDDDQPEKSAARMTQRAGIRPAMRHTPLLLLTWEARNKLVLWLLQFAAG